MGRDPDRLCSLGAIYGLEGLHQEAQGWRWHPSEKEWRIPKDALTPRQKGNIQKSLGLGSAPPKVDYTVLRELEKAGVASMRADLLWVIPDLGVDLSSVGAVKQDKNWVLDPLKSDLKALERLKNDLLQGLREKDNRGLKRVEAYNALFGKGSRLSYGLLIAWNPPNLTLQGGATYDIRNGLRSLGFSFARGAYYLDTRTVEPNIPKLKALLEVAQKAAQDKKTLQKDQTPASPKQIQYVKDLVRRYQDSWYDLTDGIWGTSPPSRETIESMSQSEARSIIDMIRQNL